MATIESIGDKQNRAITINRWEAAELIAMLTGQLAEVGVGHRCNGACPELYITDENHVQRRYVFVIDKKA